MMIYLILDVFYQENNGSTTATVSGIRFQGIEKCEILSTHLINVDHVADYESGQFYKREMPCILELLNNIDSVYDVIIIDGYVFLDGETVAGLGKHVYDNLPVPKPIIGIAKNSFHLIDENFALYRGKSKHPLFVTAIGFPNEEAKELVQKLEGLHRLPDIVKKVDHLGRGL